MRPTETSITTATWIKMTIKHSSNASRALTAGLDPVVRSVTSGGDGDVDYDDWEGFLRTWTEPGGPPVLSGCGPPIPVLSAWGVTWMTLLALIAGTIVMLAKDKPTPTCP